LKYDHLSLSLSLSLIIEIVLLGELNQKGKYKTVSFPYLCIYLFILFHLKKQKPIAKQSLARTLD